MKTLMLAAFAATLLATPVLAGEAPQPRKTVDTARLYEGRWLEIARLPMKITDGCVAGSTAYSPASKPGRIAVLDACRDRTPAGKEKTIKGTGQILDPGINAKLRVRYPFFITWDYWILDHDDDYRWFISADPKFERLFIFTRDIPSPEQRAALVRRAQDMGYDVGKLEFPPQQ